MRSTATSYGSSPLKRPTRFFVLAFVLAGLSAALSVFSVGAQIPADVEQTCTVNCTAGAPASGSSGQPISFTASATATGCATSPSYQWSFGDGSTSNQQNPTHTYAAAGSYGWTMTVSSNSGGASGNVISTVAGGQNDGSPSLQSSFYRLSSIASDPLNRGIFLGAANVNSNVIYFINTSAANVNIAGKTIAPGIVRVIAGGGNLPDGNNVPAGDLSLSSIPGLAASIDGGTLFFTESAPSRLRAINLANGVARIVAASGFTALKGISTDASAVYGADSTNPGRIVRIDPASGNVTQVPVNSTPTLLNPEAVEVVGASLFIANSGTGHVFEVGTSGGQAIQRAQIVEGGRNGGFPAGIASVGGSTYVANGLAQTVVRVFPGVQTIAGALDTCTMPPASCGDGGQISNARFNLSGPGDFSGSLPDIAANGSGIFIIDQSVNQKARVRYMNLSGAAVTLAGVTVSPNTIRTIAGTGFDLPFDGGLATSAFLKNPTGVAADGSGNLWIADTGNGRLRFVNRGAGAINVLGNEVPPGGIVTINTAPGGNQGVFPASNLLLSNPQGLFVNSQGVFVADFDSGPPSPPGFTSPRTSRVHFVNTSGSNVNFYGSLNIPPGQAATIAGGGGSDAGTALQRRLIGVSDVAVNGAGDIYLTDSGATSVRKITRSNGTVTNAPLSSTGLALGTDGLIYAVNRSAQALFRETGVGSGAFTNLTAGFSDPRDVVVTSTAAYVTQGNNQIVQVALPSLTRTTFAGTVKGFAGDGGAPTSARIDTIPSDLFLVSGTMPVTAPQTVAITAAPGGDIFFADVNNDRIRKIGSATTTSSCVRTGTVNITSNNPAPTLTTISPMSVQAGSAQFSLIVTGTGFVSGSQVRWNGNAKTTAFNGTTQLTATIPASDVATAGASTVTVFTPAPGGGTSGGVTFTSVNPLPAVTSLSPTGAAQNSAGFNLTVNGSNFVSTSVVRFAGQDRTTTYVNANQVTASIPQSDLATQGAKAVTVFNPTPGGGTSGSVNFTVTGGTPGPQGFEGDVAPRTGTDGIVALADYVQVGRFAAGLDQVNTGSEFQKADCAPRNTLGDGAVGLADYVQAGRYAAALDPATQSGGPTTPSSSLIGESAGNEKIANAAQQTRIIRINNATIARGAQGTVTVDYVAQGDENAIGLSFNFDTTQLTFVSISSPLIFIPNFMDAAAGRVGFIATQQIGQTFPAGTTTVATITFNALTTGTGSSTNITIGNNPIPVQVVRPDGTNVPIGQVTQQNGTVTLTGGGGGGNPVPTISSLSPNSVQAGSGQLTLTVNGTNFISSSEVRVNGNARATTFGGANVLTATILAGDVASTPGPTITVFNPTPGGGTSNGVVLSVTSAPPPPNPVPTLASINPTTTVAGSAAFNITLAGTNFISSSQVQWNGTNLTTMFNSAAQLTASVPANLVANAGTANVTVFNPAPGGGTTAPLLFTITSASAGPTITGFNPSSAVAGGPGFRLFVLGANYTTDSVIRLNGSDRDTRFESTGIVSTFLDATDVATPRSYTVTVFTPGPDGGTSNQATFNITTPPSITSLSPNPAIVGSPDFILTVTGVNLVSGSVVRWNEQPRVTEFVNSTTLRATILAADVQAVGMANVDVDVPNFGLTNVLPINISSGNPIPSITSLNPNTVVAGSGQFQLTVNGNGFVNGSIVRWNGADRSTSFGGSSQLTATIPASDVQAGGQAQVTVFSPGPGGGLSNALTFTITGPNPAPVITSLNPTGVLVGGPAFGLTITGTNFVQGAVVRFEGVDRAPSSVTPTQIVVTIPAEDIATAGPKSVQVVNPAPGGGPSNVLQFSVGTPNPAPTLATISPMQAVAGSGGFTLVATGTGFIPGVTVLRWNGAARSTTVVNGGQLNAQIPASDLTTPGSAQVTVFNPAPSGGESGALTFNITNPVPVITSINPNNAAVNSAAVTVTVTGSGFVPNSVVLWNGSNRTTQFVNSTQLMATIPASDLTTATTANISVSNPAPGGGTSNQVPFNVQAPSGTPTLTALDPNYANVGKPAFLLNVLGSGFAPNSVVLWNGASRQTQFVNPGQLQVAIPASDIAFAGTASVQVLNPPPGGGLSLARIFTIAYEVTSVNAASLQPPSSGGMIAQNSIVASFGMGMHLATGSAAATTQMLPTVLLGTRVQVRDSANNTSDAGIFAVTPGQVNWSMPPNVALGPAIVTITAGDGSVSIGSLDVAAVSPGLFSATSNGQGLAAAQVVRVRNGVVTFENVAQVSVVGGNLVATPIPIVMGPPTDEVYLAFYGTGIRNRTSLANVTATLGTQAIGILFAGPQGTFEGEDQVNTVRIPRSFIGAGTVNFVLTVDNKVANTVQVNFQ